jgi:hypothetical protein
MFDNNEHRQSNEIVNDVLRTNSDNEGYFDSDSRTPLEWPVNFHFRLLLDIMYRAIICILPCICQAVGDLSNPLIDSRNSSYHPSIDRGDCRHNGAVEVQGRVGFRSDFRLRFRCRFRSGLTCSMKRLKEVRFRSFVTVGRAAQLLSYSSGSILSRSGSFVRSTEV